MKKKDLSKITFCIPIRIESHHRLRNMLILLRYLSRSFHTNYIIFEADEKRYFKSLPKIKNLQYQFLKDCDPIFHRTKYINQMLKKVQTPYAAIWDTDAICTTKQIISAYNDLIENNTTMVYPFSGIFVNLTEYQTLLFDKTLNYKVICAPYLSKTLVNGFYSVGGAFMVNVKKYMLAGGENEFFYGWGPEDAERFSRMQILGEKIQRIKGDMYHLYHTRGMNSQYANMDTALQNKKEFCKVCSMDAKSLLEYINTWSWIYK